MNQTLLSFERLKASSTDGPADASHRSVSCVWARILLFLRSWNAKKAGARRRRPDAWPWEGNKAILPKKSLRTASNVEGSLQCSDRRCHVNRCHRSCREGFFAGTGPTSRQQPSDVTWLVAARLGRKRRGDHVHGYGPPIVPWTSAAEGAQPLRHCQEPEPFTADIRTSWCRR